jgi:hypothetical protein
MNPVFKKCARARLNEIVADLYERYGEDLNNLDYIEVSEEDFAELFHTDSLVKSEGVFGTLLLKKSSGWLVFNIKIKVVK